jgi:hypothetical protein
LQSHPRSPVDSLFGGGPPLPLTPRAPTVAPGRTQSETVDPDAHRAPSSEPPVWRTPRPTAFAGFPLLIPLFTRAGASQLATDDPSLLDRDWPAALLLRVARRLAIPADDPAISWLAAAPPLLAPADRAHTATLIRRARIRLSIDTGLTMRQLVRRPGAIVAARAQLDVLLEPSDADALLQRAALDADPGLVPWLGRVVLFRYSERLDVSA